VAGWRVKLEGLKPRWLARNEALRLGGVLIAEDRGASLRPIIDEVIDALIGIAALPAERSLAV